MSNPRLQVMDGKLVKVDTENGTDYANLKGMSLYWDIWGNHLWRKDVIEELKKWGCNVVRLPVGSHGDSNTGYRTTNGSDVAIGRIKRIVETAKELNMYVIVDIHNHEAVTQHTQGSKTTINFLSAVASMLGNDPNVMYEVVNEPLKVSWKEIKAYTVEAVEAVRSHAPDAVCITGIPQWCSDIEALKDPVDMENIMYSYHFYAATHKGNERGNLVRALKDGAPLFVTECGVSESSGNGTCDYDSFDQWLSILSKYGVGWCGWAVSSKKETSSTYLEGGSIIDEKFLTDTGFYYRDRITNFNFDNVPTYYRFRATPYGNSDVENHKLEGILANRVEIPIQLVSDTLIYMMLNTSVENIQVLVPWLTQNYRRFNKGIKEEILINAQAALDQKKVKKEPKRYWAIKRMCGVLEAMSKGSRTPKVYSSAKFAKEDVKNYRE